ncbi:hypothetical protein JTE90_005196 [Oedothorax gibbosus]|uniref:Methyltransferase type 11 domain-containing protein n=1 Tax=Oedothorax gibbosus TaxID=931172 RepID=A0AAV6UK43_9ARAC|nr:hypothetical protein JTE90_005196 [Oedothorax gibbosus]
MASALFAGVKHAELYAKFRPHPPDALVKTIVSYLGEKVAPPFGSALDVGCGGGQSTLALAPHFARVTGIDVSEAQIRCAQEQRPAPNVTYRVCRAGAPWPVAPSSAQLVSFGQSFHWFEPGAALGEAGRVLGPGGAVALFGHWIPLPRPPGEKRARLLHALVEQWLHDEQLGPFWDAGRRAVQGRYSDVDPRPLTDIRRRNFVKIIDSSLSDYLGYLRTWSSFQKLLKQDAQRAEDLMQQVQTRFLEVLDPAEISFPLHTDYFLILGRV